MKNISGKTLIFYTFQQRKQLQYNIIAYQPIEQQVRIKDVIEQLPIDLTAGKYHFRFKSQFFESNEKIVGWIDINNLMAKVPLINGSIYVKILKVKSNGHNKLFNTQKLAKVGLGISNQQNGNNNIGKQQNKNISPVKNIPIIQNRGQNTSEKTKVQMPNPSNINLMESNSPLQANKHSSSSTKSENVTNKKDDFLGFQDQQKIFKSNETPEQKLQFFKKTMAAEQLQKQNQKIAREELQQKINKWGYSGAKTINNLTTLLSTLHEIWPEWPAISLTELLKPEDVNTICKRALIKTHPDKNRNNSFKQRYLSKRVFQLLNDAKKAC